LELLIAGTLLGGIYVTVSIGVNIVYGVLRVVNFAHGELIMLAMYAAFWAHELWGIDPYLSGLVIVPAYFLICVTLLRRFVLWLVHSAHLTQAFSTLGISIALQNLALLLWAGNFRSIRTGYSNWLVDIGGYNLPFTRLVALVVAGVLVVVLHVCLTRTYLGKAIRATAQNRVTARLMGIDTDRIYVLVFAIGAATAALAGVLLSTIYAVFPAVGFQLVLTAFVVVVLGGLGSLPGAVIGGFVIGFVEVFSGYLISSAMKQSIYFVIFIVALVIKPAGLLGQRGSEELGIK
jgi:branched-chain amino acid transport system permease protein